MVKKVVENNIPQALKGNLPSLISTVSIWIARLSSQLPEKKAIFMNLSSFFICEYICLFIRW